MISPDTLADIPFFSGLDRSALAQVAEKLKLASANAGQTVFNAGDPGDSMFIVRFGGVYAVVPDGAGGERFRRFLGRHDIFGEMALLTDNVRSATIIAALDCEFLVLRRHDFLELLTLSPDVVLWMLRVIALRLRHTNLLGNHRRVYRTVYCHSVVGEADSSAFGRTLATAIARQGQGPVAVLDISGAVGPAATVPPRSLLVWPEAISAPDLRDVLRRQDTGVDSLTLGFVPESEAIFVSGVPRLLSILRQAYSFVVVCGPATPGTILAPGVTFARHLINQCEYLLFCLEGDIDEAERQWRMVGANALHTDRAALVLRQAGGRKAGVAVEVRKRFGRSIGFQIPSGASTAPRRDPLARLARTITGTTIGIALGGGAARGFAHLGVLAALDDAGIPVDMVGGTSFGALMGSMYLVWPDIPTIRNVAFEHIVRRKPLTDYTFPRTSLLRGRKTERIMRGFYEGLDIDELDVPFFAVAADLGTAQQVVLDHGPLWTAVMSSISIPGVFPPFPYRPGQWLVDGMVLNNVPGDIIKQKGANLAIAVNVTYPHGDHDARRDPPAGWLGRLLRRSPALRRILDAPTIGRVILRSQAISGLGMTAIRSQAFDIHIRPKVEDCDLFDFTKLDTLIARGREAGEACLPQIQATRAACATPLLPEDGVRAPLYDRHLPGAQGAA